MRRVGAFLVIATLMFLPVTLGNRTPVEAVPAPSYGPQGTWTFCDKATDVGCIEAVYFTTPANSTTLVSSDSQLSALGAKMSASCMVSSGGLDEQGRPLAQPNTDRCDPSIIVGSYYGCDKYSSAIISLSFFWEQGIGGTVMAVIRTGSFEPVFSMGAGGLSAKTIENPDGTYKYIWKGSMDRIHILQGVSNPGSFGGNSVATSSTAQASVGIFPRTMFYGSAYAYSYEAEIGRGDCVQRPIDGSWASSNAQGFSGDVMLGKRSRVAGMVNTLKFTAYGPHFKHPSTVNGSTTTLNDAYFRVYLSPVFLDSIGCENQCSNIEAALRVTTADGQVPEPKATKHDDGYLVDLGIDHFSAPNPVVQAMKISEPIQRDRQWASSFTDFPAVDKPASTPNSSKYAKSLKTKRKKSVPLRSIFVPSKSYTAKWTVSGGCRLTKTTVVARATKGTCTVKLVERKGKTVKRTRTALLTVS